MTARCLFPVSVIAGLFGVCGTANAASITAVADPQVIVPGGHLTVEFFGDFDDDPTLGGTFDILYVPSTIELAQYVQQDVGDPAFLVPPNLLERV